MALIIRSAEWDPDIEPQPFKYGCWETPPAKGTCALKQIFTKSW